MILDYINIKSTEKIIWKSVQTVENRSNKYQGETWRNPKNGFKKIHFSKYFATPSTYDV